MTSLTLFYDVTNLTLLKPLLWRHQPLYYNVTNLSTMTWLTLYYDITNPSSMKSLTLYYNATKTLLLRLTSARLLPSETVAKPGYIVVFPLTPIPHFYFLKKKSTTLHFSLLSYTNKPSKLSLYGRGGGMGGWGRLAIPNWEQKMKWVIWYILIMDIKT